MPLTLSRIQGEGDDVYGQNEPKPDDIAANTTPAVHHRASGSALCQTPNNPHGSLTDFNLWKQYFSDPSAGRTRTAGRQPNFAHSLGFVSGLSTGANRTNVYLGQNGVWNSNDMVGVDSPYIGDPRPAPMATCTHSPGSRGTIIPWPATWS